jgi:hypothetical protein
VEMSSWAGTCRRREKPPGWRGLRGAGRANLQPEG